MSEALPEKCRKPHGAAGGRVGKKRSIYLAELALGAWRGEGRNQLSWRLQTEPGESLLQGPFFPHALLLPRGLQRARSWDSPRKISSVWSYSWHGSTLGYGISNSFVGVVLVLFSNTLSLLSDFIGRFGSLRRKLQYSPGAKWSLLKGTIFQISEEEAVNTPPLLNSNNRAG